MDNVADQEIAEKAVDTYDKFIGAGLYLQD